MEKEFENVLYLPEKAPVGTVIRLMPTSIKWVVRQGEGQYIVYGGETTTVGMKGAISCPLYGIPLELVCFEKDLGWAINGEIIVVLV